MHPQAQKKVGLRRVFDPPYLTQIHHIVSLRASITQVPVPAGLDLDAQINPEPKEVDVSSSCCFGCIGTLLLLESVYLGLTSRFDTQDDDYPMATSSSKRGEDRDSDSSSSRDRKDRRKKGRKGDDDYDEDYVRLV